VSAAGERSEPRLEGPDAARAREADALPERTPDSDKEAEGERGGRAERAENGRARGA